MSINPSIIKSVRIIGKLMGIAQKNNVQLYSMHMSTINNACMASPLTVATYYSFYR